MVKENKLVMCVAVIKPKGAELPTESELLNCFNNNPHGAGYMYIDNNQLHIKKGFMDFKSCYDSFHNENFTVDDAVFIHFRIATHGLIDGGNTHPFPLTQDTDLMRKTDCVFNGFGMMHNGVFGYEKVLFQFFDPTGVISDTMLFGKLIDYSNKCNFNDKDDFIAAMIKRSFSVEKEISRVLKMRKDNNNQNIDTINMYINTEIGHNKVAIMSDEGWFVKFGSWIEHNGCFYSNYDYLEPSYDEHWIRTFYGFNGTDKNCCDICGKLYNESELHETTVGMACKECINDYPFYECEQCGLYDLIEGDEENGENTDEELKLCRFCQEDSSAYCCDFCNKKSNYYKITDDGKLICESCYHKLNV